MQYSKEKLLSIRDSIKSKQLQPTTEEATKQWLIMPFMIALGYDPYSSDIVPEYSVDVGIKKGEKVDYALQINGQPIVLVECKQLGTILSEKHISQLYRYFTTSDVHIAILTNGDDYLFFTDSKKRNIMDLEPYFKIKLSDSADTELDKLEQYSKDKIQYADIAQVIQNERYADECKNFVSGLKNNQIQSWVIEALADRAGIRNIDKPALAKILYAEIENQFDWFWVEVTNSSVQEQQEVKQKWKKDSSRKSNIKLNHEYVYNDYSDGSWEFHRIDYAVILGTKYDNMNAAKLLVQVVTQLLDDGYITRQKLLDSPEFKGAYRIGEIEQKLGKDIEKYNLSIRTAYGIGDIMKFIGKLLKFADIQDSEVKISFRS